MTRHLPRDCNYFAARWIHEWRHCRCLLTPYDRPTATRKVTLCSKSTPVNIRAFLSRISDLTFRHRSVKKYFFHTNSVRQTTWIVPNDTSFASLFYSNLRNAKAEQEVRPEFWIGSDLRVGFYRDCLSGSSRNRETHSSVATMRGISSRFDTSVARYR